MQIFLLIGAILGNSSPVKMDDPTLTKGDIREASEMQPLTYYSKYRDFFWPHFELAIKKISPFALTSNLMQKRHLFLSDGWGAGGRPLTMAKVRQGGKKNRQLSSKIQVAEKIKDAKNSKNLRYNTLKWSIPGLFGQF